MRRRDDGSAGARRGRQSASTWSRSGIANVRLAVLLCLCVLVAGTLGYHLIEGWDFFESFYMTVITISTVGFEEVRQMDGAGRLLTVMLILGGVGALGYTATSITAILVTGEIRLAMRGRRMERRLSRLRDHVILCGYGKIGREIGREFLRSGENLCVVDTNERKVESALDSGLLALIGDATEEETLERCGIRRARGVLPALPGDSDNLFVTLTSRELNPRIQIVARGLEPSSEGRLLRAGADHVVSPYVIGGGRMAAVVLNPGIVDFLDIFMKKDAVGYSLSQLKVAAESSLAGKRLGEARLRENSGGAMVLGLLRDEEMHRLPGGDTEILPGDELIVLGTQQMMDRLKEAGV